MTQEEVAAGARAVQTDLNAVAAHTANIGNAALEMSNYVCESFFAVLKEVQQDWAGGKADAYVLKANDKMKEIVQDCADIYKAAVAVRDKYVDGEVRTRLTGLGIDPDKVLKTD